MTPNVSHPQQPSDVEDNAHAHASLGLPDLETMKRGGLDDGPPGMPRWVDRLAAEDGVHARRRDLGPAHVGNREALQVVDIETLVEPVHKQGLDGRAACRYLAALKGLDRVDRHDEVESPEGALPETSRPVLAPGRDTD